MIYKSTPIRLACLTAIAIAFVLVSGQSSSVNAQRDPFAKASWAKEKKPAPVNNPSAGSKTGVAATPVNYGPPMIEARIEYYKRLREQAAANGQPLPKVTSVLTLSEMIVTGIFKTPRGYAAMVEATPIKLSYTIYPGEKFFDGQLVAVEENKLIFRKVTKTAPGKFVASVEDKPLQQYNMKAVVQGTAPSQDENKPVQVAAAPVIGSPAGPIISPVDEMNNAPAVDDTKKKPAKKPAKAAKAGK
ncbi:MAG: hypothetical protein KA956_09650 [Pyrinomonadaceae bacterium]|nr:hypothetical protein [Acidobacteriota bacterium]MBP7376728.1 hypothetical protein [Pyrinomonadaceae bacterium]